MPRLSQNNDLPVAITNLRLCTALQDCGAIGVANAFDKSSAEHLYVYDDGNLGYTDWTDVAPEFVTKCFAQLWHTFDGIIKPRCAKKSKDVEQMLSVDFYVVFDKDLEVTGANAELMDLQIQFLTDNNHPLYFDNGKTFQ